MLKNSQAIYQQIEKSFETQTFSFVYFFFGEENFLVRQAATYLRTMALHGCEIEFNDTVFDGGQLDLARLAEELQTLPMMFSRRFIEIRNVEQTNESTWKELIKLLSNPFETAVVLLTGGILDKRKSSYIQVEKLSTSVEFRKPFENQISGWIKHLAAALGLEIEEEAAELFHENVGSNLAEIDLELKKLSNYLGERKKIQLADIEKVVTSQKQWNVFEFVDHVATGSRKSALISVVHLLDQGQNELGIVTLLYRHYRQLRATKVGESLGFSGAKLVSYVGLFPRQLDRTVRQSRQLSFDKIDQAVLLLAETEKAIKSSPLSTHLWIENLVLSLTDPKSLKKEVEKIQVYP